MRFEETLGISHLVKILQQELRQKIDSALKPLRISFAQYSVLSALEEKPGQTNADLARKCSVTPQSMIRVTQDLEDESFIVKDRHPTHGLLYQFQLTKKGLKTICDAHVAVNKVELGMVKGFSKAEIVNFISALKRGISGTQF